MPQDRTGWKGLITFDDRLSHEEFVRGLETNELAVELDSEKASELATEGILGATLRLNAYTWGCVWVACLLLTPVLVIAHSWWWLVFVPVGLLLPLGLRWMNYRAILYRLKESEEFYERSVENDVITGIKKTNVGTNQREVNSPGDE